jgi:hypothetical protein
VFILEHYFTSKSFAAVRGAFKSAYPDKEVPNTTAIHKTGNKILVDACFREFGGHLL